MSPCYIILKFADARRNLMAADLPDALTTTAKIVEKNGLTVSNLHTMADRLIVEIADDLSAYVYVGGF